MLNIVSNTDYEELDNLLSKLQKDYKDKNFISVINIFHTILNNNAFKDSYQINLFLLYQIYSYAFASYIITLDYQKALEIISQFYTKYLEICKLYTYILNIRKKEKQQGQKNEAQKEIISLINRLKSQFEIFNQEKYVEFYVNLAFANYKNKKHLDAIYYYDIAINKIEKTNKNPINLIELYVGKAQSLYYCYNKKLNENGVNNTIQEYINIISKNWLDSNSVEILFALAKLYYFINKKDYAINYIELALDKINKENIEDINYKIYAYDWLSRITYSSEQYATANKLYDQLISLIIEDKQNANYTKSSNNIIYPKPILADMVKFLNETNNMVAKKEASYVYKSIYLGIIVSSILGIAEMYSGNKDSCPIILITLVIIFISCLIVNWIYK